MNAHFEKQNNRLGELFWSIIKEIIILSVRLRISIGIDVIVKKLIIAVVLLTNMAKPEASKGEVTARLSNRWK